MNFAPFNAHTTPSFKNCSILKFIDIINTESFTFVSKCFSNNSSSIFNESFKLASTTHSYNTISARKGLLFAISYISVIFGIIHSTTLIWNHLQDKLAVYGV